MVSSCCHSNKAINHVYFNIHGIKVHHFKIGLDQTSSKTFYIPQKSLTNLLTLRMMEVGTFIFTPIWWNLCIRNWQKNKIHLPSCNHGTIVLVQVSQSLGIETMKKNYIGHEVQVLAWNLNKRELPHEYEDTIKKWNYQDCVLMLQQPCVRKELGKLVINHFPT